jgi:hypothetical protein
VLAVALGLMALVAVAAMIFIEFLAFYLGYFAPCALAENQCSASTSTRIVAIGSVPLAIVATASMLAVALYLFTAAASQLDESWRRALQFFVAAVSAAVLWYVWHWLYPADPSDTPKTLLDNPPDCTVEGPGPGAVLLGRAVLAGYGTESRPLGSELPAERTGDGWTASIDLHVLATRQPVTLKVPPGPESVLIDWNLYAEPLPSRSVKVDEPSYTYCDQPRWIVRPGGFFFERPACAELTVIADGREATIPVGLGRDC